MSDVNLGEMDGVRGNTGIEKLRWEAEREGRFPIPTKLNHGKQ